MRILDHVAQVNRIGLILLAVISAIIIQGHMHGIGSRVASAAPQFYIVEPGDTLSEIAERFDVSVSTLQRINGLASPDFLQVGQVLALGISPARQGGQLSYTVLPGDNLTSIAQRFGVTAEDIAELNGLRNMHLILPGEMLAIPQSDSSAPSSRSTDAAELGVLSVPYRTQFDGSTYEEGNCGPATLGMLLDYYGQHWSSDELRRLVNQSTGYWGLDGGADWESLVYAAESHGFRVRGLYTGPKQYRQWTIEDLMQEVEQGYPVMLLVRYQLLPGHEGQAWWGDHYIVFLGLNAAGEVVYHDSAFRGHSRGAYLTMSQATLLKAWARTSVGISNSAMVLDWPGS